MSFSNELDDEDELFPTLSQQAFFTTNHLLHLFNPTAFMTSSTVENPTLVDNIQQTIPGNTQVIELTTLQPMAPILETPANNLTFTQMLQLPPSPQIQSVRQPISVSISPSSSTVLAQDPLSRNIVIGNEHYPLQCSPPVSPMIDVTGTPSPQPRNNIFFEQNCTDLSSCANSTSSTSSERSSWSEDEELRERRRKQKVFTDKNVVKRNRKSGGIHTGPKRLWCFLLEQMRTRPDLIEWVDEEHGVFRVKNKEKLSEQWAIQKGLPQKPRGNAGGYDTFGRAMRQASKERDGRPPFFSKREPRERLVWVFTNKAPWQKKWKEMRQR